MTPILHPVWQIVKLVLSLAIAGFLLSIVLVKAAFAVVFILGLAK